MTRRKALDKMKKISQKSIDKRVSAAYNARCHGIQVSILDMPRIAEVGKKAVAEGADDATLQQKIYDFVQTIRKN